MSTAINDNTVESKKGLWHLFPRLCKGCGLCKEKCPKKCLSWSSQLGAYGTPSVEPDAAKCSACGICAMVCPDCAITVVKKK